jgi:hypothetical protein
MHTFSIIDECEEIEADILKRKTIEDVDIEKYQKWLIKLYGTFDIDYIKDNVPDIDEYNLS